MVEKRANNIRDNKPTKLENIEIEKGFSSGDGVERRADVYYEKHYTKSNGEVVIEKFAVEVQRNNISYPELLERNDWYKENNIAPFWIILDHMFDNNKEEVQPLPTNQMDLSLLTLISFSMKNYNGRFFTYDSDKRKILTLSLQQENIEKFNELEDSERRSMKKNYHPKNLYIVSKEKEGDYYKLVSYAENRHKYNIYSDVTSFGIFKDTKDIMHCHYNEKKKVFEFAKFIKLGKSIHIKNDNTIQKSAYKI